MESISRSLPAPARAIAATASGSYARPISSKMPARCFSRSSSGMSLKSRRIQRERMVAGILCGSVVARMNTACAGGSSSVLRSALKALSVSMCTSSMIYTLYLHETGGYCTFSRRSRISLTPLLDAASISTISSDPSASARHVAHLPQGEPFTGCSQLIARAKMRATLVFPVPRGPVKRYACPTSPRSIWLTRTRTTCSCRTIASNVAGRNLR